MLTATGFAGTAEVVDLVEQGVLATYDLIIAAQGPTYFQTSVDLNTTADVGYVALPSDFYRLLAVLGNDLASAGSTRSGWVKLRSANPHDLADLYNTQGGDVSAVQYQLSGAYGSQSVPSAARLLLWPVPAASYTVRVQYIPTCSPETYVSLAVEGGENRRYDGIHGWEEYAVLWASVRLLALEETDTSPLERQMAEMRDRIAGLAGKRDLVEPEYVGSVRPRAWDEWSVRSLGG